jgi:hypothetical protein
MAILYPPPPWRTLLPANLTMMYWFATWRLPEVDDSEVRDLATRMVRDPIARDW